MWRERRTLSNDQLASRFLALYEFDTPEERATMRLAILRRLDSGIFVPEDARVVHVLFMFEGWLKAYEQVPD